MFKILWPIERFVTAAEMVSRFWDAVANGKVDKPEGTIDAHFAAKSLHESGEITLANPS